MEILEKQIETQFQEPTKEDRRSVASVHKRVDELASTVNTLVEAVANLVKKFDTPTKFEYNPETTKVSDYKPKGYVPPKYRQICDEVLSPEFGLDCEESTVSMDFTIHIIVPDRYSSLTEKEKEMGVKDIRSRVVSRALGENGVREWCVKVRENLNKFFSKSGVVSPFTSQVIV